MKKFIASPIVINRSYAGLFVFLLLFSIFFVLKFPWSTHWLLGIVLYVLICSALLLAMFLLKKTPAIIMDDQKITIRLPGGGQIYWSEIRSTAIKRPVRAGTVLEIELLNGSKHSIGLSSLDMSPTKIHELILDHLNR